MQHSDHPQPESLSALAAGDADARSDSTLNAHVRDCPQCAGVVADLNRLRAALGELPDLVPHRPLQLLPPAPEPARAAGGSGWLRRLAAPALAAGAGLVLIGSVGIGASLLGGMASGAGAMFQNVGNDLEAAESDARGVTASGALVPGASPQAEPMATAGDTAESPGSTRLSGSGDEPFNGWFLLVGAGAILLTTGLLLRYVINPRAG